MKNHIKKKKRPIRKIRVKIKLYINRLLSFIKSNWFATISIIFLLVLSNIYIPLPESAKIIDSKNFKDILIVIIGSLSSILGIVVAVQLVAFELIRKTFATFAFKDFFRTSHNKYFFITFIITIVISFIALLNLKEEVTSQNYYLLYYCIALFIYSIFILYPSTRKLLLASKSKKKIQEIINSIDRSSVEIFNRSVSFQVYSDQLDRIENSPIFILSEVCLRAIVEEDRIIPRFILIESNNRLLILLKEGNQNFKLRETINSFFMIYKPVFNKAAEMRQNGVLYTLINVIESIHYFCAKNKYQWDTMIELNEEIEREVIVLLEYNNIELAKQYIWSIERIMLNHLENNTPPANEIRDLSEDNSKWISDFETDKSLQWDHVAHNYIDMLNRIIEKAIEIQKTEFVGSALRVLVSIGWKSKTSEKVEEKKKNVLIRFSYFYASSLIVKCADEGLLKKDSFMIPFNSSVINKIIEPNTDYTIVVLQSIGNTYMELARRNALPSFMLNEIGTTGRICMSKINDSDIYKDSSMYFVYLLVKLHQIVSSNTPIDKDRLLWQIYHQAKSIRDWYKGDVEKNKVFFKEMDDQVSKIEMKLEHKEPPSTEIPWYKIN